jgi:hypothetical protein
MMSKLESRRAIAAVIATAFMIVFAVDSVQRIRIRLEATSTTLSWICGVIAIVFGVSSICRRERPWPLSLASVLLAALVLCDVLRLVAGPARTLR